MGTKENFRRTLDAFGAGKIDILIGTQMIAKGLDFPNVSLVGIVNGDGAVNFPDFRANEHVFQSIVQVSGRAGRGTKPGVVVVQTRCPESALIAMAVKNDGAGFLRNELVAREEFGYPPFAHLIRLIFAGKNEGKTALFAKQFAESLPPLSVGTFIFRGPAPAAIQKVRDHHRFSILCFTKNVAEALDKISTALDPFRCVRDPFVAVDVDPADML
jgi:primosomal protein N' (replication factor Y)